MSSASDWDEIFTGLHGASRIKVPDRRAPWSGHLEWQRSKTYSLALCTGGEEVVDRDNRHIRTDPRGTYELLVPLSGSAWVEQGAASGEIGPGVMALCDIDRPLTFARGADLRSVSLIVSGQHLAARSQLAAGGPHPLAGDRGPGRVVRQLTTTLHEEREHLSETTFDLDEDVFVHQDGAEVGQGDGASDGLDLRGRHAGPSWLARRVPTERAAGGRELRYGAGCCGVEVRRPGVRSPRSRPAVRDRPRRPDGARTRRGLRRYR
ncbi:hypothetical protein ACFWOB_00450 [Streptomyces sp. NPDC058420]|uniref:AraC-like ligand-binding domain-containing protein n=1 Tax=Streptomyces sp. NPDC058420 TaxID=3346489 RepID=UPI00366141A6